MRNVSQYLRLKYKFWIINYWISSDSYNITDKSQKLPFEIVISYLKNRLKLTLKFVRYILLIHQYSMCLITEIL